MFDLDRIKQQQIIFADTEISYTHSLQQKNNEPHIVLPISISTEEYKFIIYNPIRVLKEQEPMKSINDLIGLKIMDILEEKDRIILRLNHNTSIEVDIGDGAYSGPEAMCLYGPDNLIVVWN